MTGSSRTRWPAAGLSALGVGEGVFALVAVLATGMSFAAARDSFLISNAMIGIACAGCGGLIAWHRPRNPLGWLLLGAGVAQPATAAVTPWLVRALQDGASDGLVRSLATAYSAAWPWSVSLFIPLAVLYFPDGRPPGRGWSWAVPVVAVNSVLQVLLFGSDPNPLAAVADLGPETRDRALSWWAVPALDVDGPVQLASDLVLGASLLAGLVGLVLRYRVGDERTRRQLLWLLLAATACIVIVLVSRLPGPIDESGFPIILTSVITLVPISMTIAVLRHRLLDIRFVWSRTVTYLLLTAAVVAVYLGLVELADRLLRQQLGVGASVLVTLLVAAGFHPVRVRLQRRVDRLLYGDRADPVRTASTVSAQLADGAEHPADVLPVLCRALRLPYASLSHPDGLLAEWGTRPDQVEWIPLPHAAELHIGVRYGQRRLDPADRAVLELLAVPIGVALRASALAETVRRSRHEIVAAREEERRRLHRDLHDGLGPVLTGIAFQADAVVNLARTDPDQVRLLGTDIRTDVTGAITDVRRLINQLHPSALDEVGLVEALRRHAQRLDRRSDGAPIRVCVNAAEALSELPAAVEVAAYRIVTEALTNVARHAGASRVDVDVAESAPGELLLTVQDDGGASATAWAPGVGLRSMHDRATELGGVVHAAPTPAGGRVHARLPIGAPR